VALVGPCRGVPPVLDPAPPDPHDPEPGPGEKPGADVGDRAGAGGSAAVDDGQDLVPGADGTDASHAGDAAAAGAGAGAGGQVVPLDAVGAASEAGPDLQVHTSPADSPRPGPRWISPFRVVVLVVVLAAALVAWDLTRSSSPAYRTALVGSGTVESTLDSVGTITPVNQADLNFNASGTVSAVDVSVGQGHPGQRRDQPDRHHDHEHHDAGPYRHHGDHHPGGIGHGRDIGFHVDHLVLLPVDHRRPPGHVDL